MINLGFCFDSLFFCQPAVTDGNQSEVKAKPVPRPRSKFQPKAGCNGNNNILDSVDKASNTTNAVVSGAFLTLGDIVAHISLYILVQ